MKLRKIVFAAMLAAISIVIDLLFKSVIPNNTIGTAYYAIPIVICGIFLGLKYSVVVAILCDTVGVLVAGQTFLPLFMLAPIFWGLIPALLLNKDSDFREILIVILVTHIFVTGVNSLALVVHIFKSWKGLIADLPFRLGLLIPNSIVISLLVQAIMEPLLIKPSFINNLNK